MLRQNRIRLLSVVLGLLVISSFSFAQGDSPVVIRWFVGLGTGINPEQIPLQEQIVADFNDTHDDIQLEVQFVDTDVAIDTLSTLIASGDAPDIVGPVGVEGSNAFADAWLDLQPLVDETGYDLTQFDEQAVDFYRVEGQGLVGLPFGVFPSFIAYNRALFDEADLNYPPEEFGAPYVMPDGTEVEWNIDTMTEIARLLTVDAEGYDATEAEFDRDDVVQYGYSGMFNSSRGQATLFGAGSVVDEDGNAQIPDEWDAAWRWYHDAIFGDQPFMPDAATAASDAWGSDNTFSSGKIAMANLHLWYPPCCLGTTVTEWGIGAVPAYDGTITAKLHADNFRILETTDHPAEAFEVLLYLTDERGTELLQVYGGMPARASEQAAFFESYAQNYSEDINWDVAIDALSYADIPSHESYMPSFAEADVRLNAFGNLYQSSADIDLDAEIATLRDDLQQIFDDAR